MKKILYLLMILAAYFPFSNTASAQASPFKLADYKYRTTGYKALSFLGSSNGSFGTGNKTENKNFGLYPTVAYRHQYSTDARQYYFQVLPSASLNLQDGSEAPLAGGNTIKSKSSNFSASTEASLTIRDFKKDFFIEYGGTVAAGAGAESRTPSSFAKTKTSHSNYSLLPFIGAGKGRLEDVSDAQMALFILDDLKNAGKLKKELSEAMVYAFSQLITRVYNRRIFDYRKRRMYELEKIDSFFKANDLLTSCDITSYNIINDNWSFAIQPSSVDAIYLNSGSLVIANSFNYLSDRVMKDGVLGQPARFSGKQLYVRLLPGITTNNTTNKTDTSNLKNTSMGYGVNAVFGYEDRKPVSMKLQVNKFASLNFGYNINKQDITNTNPVVKTLQKNTSSAVSLSGGMSIGYYPNSRTSVQGGGTLGIYKLLKISSGQSTGPVMFAPSVFINGNYFLNYFSRVRGNAAISYISKSNSSTGRFNFSFTVGYVQYIF